MTLLSASWFLPLAWLVAIYSFYRLQVFPSLEHHMLSTYGDEYAGYKERTNLFLPSQGPLQFCTRVSPSEEPQHP